MLTLDQVYPVSNSRLTAFKKSPKHLIHYLTEPKEQTPAMAFGVAFHAYLLEPVPFMSRFAIAPNVDRRTKEGKLEYDKFVYEAEDKTIISQSDYNKIQEMTDAIRSNTIAGELISNLIKTELDCRWINEDTGIEMRGIIDGIGIDYIIDIKTCQDAHPMKFGRDAVNMNYHRQAAIYLDSHPERKNYDYYLIAIERDAPYGCSVNQITEEAINSGRKQYIDMLIEYHTWIENGMPESGYEYWHYNGVFELNLPTWKKLEEL